MGSTRTECETVQYTLTNPGIFGLKPGDELLWDCSTTAREPFERYCEIYEPSTTFIQTCDALQTDADQQSGFYYTKIIDPTVPFSWNDLAPIWEAPQLTSSDEKVLTFQTPYQVTAKESLPATMPVWHSAYSNTGSTGILYARDQDLSNDVYTGSEIWWTNTFGNTWNLLGAVEEEVAGQAIESKSPLGGRKDAMTGATWQAVRKNPRPTKRAPGPQRSQGGRTPRRRRLRGRQRPRAVGAPEVTPKTRTGGGDINAGTTGATDPEHLWYTWGVSGDGTTLFAAEGSRIWLSRDSGVSWATLESSRLTALPHNRVDRRSITRDDFAAHEAGISFDGDRIVFKTRWDGQDDVVYIGADGQLLSLGTYSALSKDMQIEMAFAEALGGQVTGPGLVIVTVVPGGNTGAIWYSAEDPDKWVRGKDIDLTPTKPPGEPVETYFPYIRRVQVNNEGIWTEIAGYDNWDPRDDRENAIAHEKHALVFDPFNGDARSKSSWLSLEFWHIWNGNELVFTERLRPWQTTDTIVEFPQVSGRIILDGEEGAGALGSMVLDPEKDGVFRFDGEVLPSATNSGIPVINGDGAWFISASALTRVSGARRSLKKGNIWIDGSFIISDSGLLLPGLQVTDGFLARGEGLTAYRLVTPEAKGSWVSPIEVFETTVEDGVYSLWRLNYWETLRAGNSYLFQTGAIGPYSSSIPSVPVEYLFDTTKDRVWVVPNSNYLLHFSGETATYTLRVNVFNSPRFMDWILAAEAVRFSAAHTAYVRYCENLRAAGGYDPACSCMEDERVVKSMFYWDLLSEVEKRQLMDIAPCLTLSCGEATRGLARWRREDVCGDRAITICSNIIADGTDVGEGINQENNCGSTSIGAPVGDQLPCVDGECPIGYECYDGTYCVTQCDTTADCGSDATCSEGLCRSTGSGGGGGGGDEEGLETWVWILIGVGVGVLMIGLAAGLWSRRQKKKGSGSKGSKGSKGPKGSKAKSK